MFNAARWGKSPRLRRVFLRHSGRSEEGKATELFSAVRGAASSPCQLGFQVGSRGSC